jgi:hypothetical protein
MTATINAGIPSYPVTSSKRKAWLKRLDTIESVIIQTGATATYRPHGHFDVAGTEAQLEAARQALARRRVTWEAGQ